MYQILNSLYYVLEDENFFNSYDELGYNLHDEIMNSNYDYCGFDDYIG